LRKYEVENKPARKRVLSVGQCYADHLAIAGTLERHFGAETLRVDDGAEALTRLRQERFALVLVNRVMDRDGSQGLELIKEMQADEELRSVPAMLVSNYEDSQEEAVKHGAKPGFGKAALGQPRMLSRVKPCLE
jgi:two-component system, chemotaxis family, chemotaxis protein CheY